MLKPAATFLLFLTSYFLLLTSNIPASAQDALSPDTINTIIEEARNNNPEIQAMRQNVKAKEVRARAEGILDDPSLRVEMMDLSKENPFPAPGNAMQTRYEISQMLPYPGKLSLQKRMALLEVLMAAAELKAKEIEIITMLKEAYYEYLFINESIRVANEIKGLISNMARIAEIKYATGEVAQQDVIKAQVELTMLINEIIVLEAEKEVVQAEIKGLLSRAQDTPLLEPAGMPEKKPAINSGDLINKAIEVNPALQIMRYEIEVKGLEVELAKKNYYPDFMLGIAPIQREGRFDAWDAMFQVNIPIWRTKYDNQVGAAVNTVEAFKSKLRGEENIKAAEVKEGAIKVETADKIRQLYETSLLPQTELSFNSALKNYQTGRVDFLTLIDTERVLKKTKIEHLDTVITYYKRVASLERVVGEELAE
ncbi:MAG: TolC family protein [Nitrospirae bacterium]|nr:TolC family protein [Nitrospirota bacterium]